MLLLLLLLLLAVDVDAAAAFLVPRAPATAAGVARKGRMQSPQPHWRRQQCRHQRVAPSLLGAGNDGDVEEEWSDFDGYVGDDFASYGGGGADAGEIESAGSSLIGAEGGEDSSSTSPSAPGTNLSELLFKSSSDLTGCQSRQFSLGPDLLLSDYVGTLGFEEVTDWEYYYPSEDPESDDRKVVAPNPLDPESQPRRTRESSGSVVRVFRGEFVGTLGGLLRSQALDGRVLVREYSGDNKFATRLAQSELDAVSRLQSRLLRDEGKKNSGGGNGQDSWIPAAAARNGGGDDDDDGSGGSDNTDRNLRKDNRNVVELVKMLQGKDAPYVGILGTVNLDDVEFDPNEFYRALGVPPPKPDSVWIVYAYAGLSTLQATFAGQPPIVRLSKLPPKRGIFGGVVDPPPLPSFEQRATYVKAIVKGIVDAVATLHESGVVHRSIGRGSVLLSTTASDKREASSPYATSSSQLRVKLSDFGFAGRYEGSTDSAEFCARARTFGLSGVRRGDNTAATANFAMAEDMHAAGFVVMGLLLTALAELPTPGFPVPPTDEDTLQRLLTDIFDKDMNQFREYIAAEEVIWSKLVALLDENDGAGWSVLETLLLAREKAVEKKDTMQLFAVRQLLSNPFFAS